MYKLYPIKKDPMISLIVKANFQDRSRPFFLNDVGIKIFKKHSFALVESCFTKFIVFSLDSVERRFCER